MGTATVIGRDELGRIIDIHVSTEEDVDPPGPETVTAGGGAQQVRLLGPFHVTHDDAAAVDTGSKLADLVEGTVIIRAWALVTEQFAGDISTATIAMGNASTGDWVGVTTYEVDELRPNSSGGGSIVERATTTVAGTVAAEEIVGSVVTLPVVGMATSACDLLWGMSTGGGSITAGEMDIYALIAEPA